MRGASNSSGQRVPFFIKVAEWCALFRMRLKGRGTWDQQWVFDNLEEYNSYLRTYCSCDLEGAKVLEIGYGARPLPLMALISMGIDAQGVDLDQPILGGGLREFARIFRSNGAERALKSFVRYQLFDRPERRALGQALRKRCGRGLDIPANRFHVYDAASDGFAKIIGNQQFDLIFSEDVFEHIPPGSVERVASRMAGWLKPTGIALVRPNIYSGITGNHLPEWYSSAVNVPMERRSVAWEHLRQDRFQANTYLNKLWRSDYQRVFAAHFEILQEKVRDPDLGRQFLVGDTQEALKNIPDVELFSNQVLFVLRKKP